MDNQNKNHEKILRGCQWVFFIIYVIFLLRITFFKQVTLNNLFSAIGASERTISIIPFKSIYDMAVSNTSIVLHPVSFYSLLFFQILLYFMKKGIWRK